MPKSESSCAGVKKVLMVDGGVAFGGSLIVLARLANAIDKGRFMPVVVTSTPLSEVNHLFDKSVRLRYIKQDVSYVDRIRFSETISSLPFLFRKVLIYIYTAYEKIKGAKYKKEVARLVKEEKVDLVHANNNLQPVEIALSERLPCLYHFHGFVDLSSYVHKSLISRCSGYLSISRSVTDSVTRQGVLDESRILTVYNPIAPLEMHSKMELSQLKLSLGLQGKNIVGVFGRLIRWKGQKEFLDAFSIVCEKDHDAVALLVGSDDEFKSYADELQQHVRKLGLENKVIFCGYVKNTFLYYQICDVVVHCSIEPEPFGLVITEAMQNRVPIIASIYGAGSELVKDGETGLLADPRDPTGLAGKIEMFLKNPELRSACKERAYKYVTSKMSAAAYARKVEKFYCHVIGHDNPR